MLTLLLLLVIGIFLGRMLRSYHYVIAQVDRLTMLSIWALLFLLGIAIGSNPAIISRIGTLGVQAGVIAVCAMIGSIGVSSVIFVYFFKHEKESRSH